MPMPIFTRRLGVQTDAEAAGTLRLTYDWRQKSRCRVRVAEAAAAPPGRPAPLSGGQEVGLDLPRGAVLREGDRIATDDGIVLCVHAAVEQLLQVRAADALSLARIAYHLGNRHVPVQVGRDEEAGWLRLPLDHVLENMVEGLGGKLQVVSAPFDPEAGAYAAGHSHGAGHSHDAGTSHDAGHRLAPGVADDGRDAVPPDRRHAPRIHDFLDDTP